MNTNELAAIPVWVKREVAQRRIPELFSELASIVQSNANGSPQAFESQRTALINAVNEVDLTSLTDAQADFLTNQLNLVQHLGHQGVEQIEDILYRNRIDVATAAAEMNRISSEIQTAIDRSNQIKAALSGLISPVELPGDEILIRIVFNHKAAITDVVDLKKWASEWHDISRGISMAIGETPEDVRVVGAETGSIIFTLATTYGIAKVISTILLKALELAEKVQGLRKIQLEIEGMKFSNQSSLLALKQQEKDERASGLNAIAEYVSKDMRLDGEQLNALEKSINKLLGFIEKGGEVDLVLPHEDGEEEKDVDPEKGRLSKNVARIRELERSQRLMPFLAEDDE